MSINLCFMNNEKLVIPNQCFITALKNKVDGTHNIMVTIVHPTMGKPSKKLRDQQVVRTDLDDMSSENSKARPKVRLSYEDIRKIREGRNMILNNLQMDIPNLKDLARQLGTNEFKLKYGFRELYGTTVFKYLLQERLRMGKTLVQYTKLNFKTIAKMAGFKSVPHFNRVFQEQYDSSPKVFREKAKSEEI